MIKEKYSKVIFESFLGCFQYDIAGYHPANLKMAILGIFYIWVNCVKLDETMVWAVILFLKLLYIFDYYFEGVILNLLTTEQKLLLHPLYFLSSCVTYATFCVTYGTVLCKYALNNLNVLFLRSFCSLPINAKN